MTQENLKRLLEHYRKVGRKDLEEDVIKKYPSLESEPEKKVKGSKTS